MAPSLYKKTVSAVLRSLMTTHSVSGEGFAFEVPSALTTVTDEKSGSLSVESVKPSAYGKFSP